VLDAADHRHVAALGQRDSAARAARAAGAADAVHVVLGLQRQAVVDDVADGRHVDAAGGHVGGHQDAQLARTQALKHAVAAALRHAAVQRRCGVAHLVQAVGQTVSVDLGAGEHHGLVDITVGQQVVQQLVLVVQVVGPHQLLADVLVLGGVAGDLDAFDVLVLQAHGQLPDLAVEGGAGHQGLAVLGQRGGDVLDVFDEAHVQHAVGFVKHQHFDVVQHGLAAAEVVDQAAGGRDEDVQRAAQGFQLSRIRHAADHRGDGQERHIAPVVGGRLGDLHGEFTGGHQHQDARAAHHIALRLLGRILAGGQHLHQRGQHEGSRLAAAGVGAHAQILAGERGRDGAGLHVGGVFVLGGAQCAHQGLVEAKRFKSHD